MTSEVWQARIAIGEVRSLWWSTGDVLRVVAANGAIHVVEPSASKDSRPYSRPSSGLVDASELVVCRNPLRDVEGIECQVTRVVKGK